VEPLEGGRVVASDRAGVRQEPCVDSLSIVAARRDCSGRPNGFEANMPEEEWIKTLEDGRKVKFIYQELAEDAAFITAQLAGNEVVYSVVLTKVRYPLIHEDVENRFKDELSKKYTV
jgi:hypothetical protein